LVCSIPDQASVNIRDRLLEAGGWSESGSILGNPAFSRGETLMVTIEQLHLRVDHIDDMVQRETGKDIESVIFLSRHRAVSGQHSLTVHPIGNFGRAEFGGRENALVPSAPHLMTSLLRRLKKEAGSLAFEVAFEVTHHGPYLETPTLFIEIGSSEETWGSREAAKAIATSILEAEVTRAPVCIGIGGGHYAPRFTEVALSKEVSFGHMIANYALDLSDIPNNEARIRQALEASGSQKVYIHKKSMKRSEATGIAKLVGSMGAEVVDSSFVSKEEIG